MEKLNGQDVRGGKGSKRMERRGLDRRSLFYNLQFILVKYCKSSSVAEPEQVRFEGFLAVAGAEKFF